MPCRSISSAVRCPTSPWNGGRGSIWLRMPSSPAASSPARSRYGWALLSRRAELDVPPLADARDAHHAGAVAVAPVGVGRRPGAGQQPLVAVDRRRAESGQRVDVGEDAAQEPAADLGKRHRRPRSERQIVLAVRVPEAEMDVQAVPGPVRVQLRHEGRDIAMLAGDIAHGLLEREIVVDALDRVRVLDRHLVLAGAVLLAELRDGHAHCRAARRSTRSTKTPAPSARPACAEHPRRVDRLIVAVVSTDEAGRTPARAPPAPKSRRRRSSSIAACKPGARAAVPDRAVGRPHPGVAISAVPGKRGRTA